jgi:hypothetical protein
MVFECLNGLPWRLWVGTVIIKHYSILTKRSCLQFCGGDALTSTQHWLKTSNSNMINNKLVNSPCLWASFHTPPPLPPPPPHPLFQWYPLSKEILLHLIMKCSNSAFSVECHPLWMLMFFSSGLFLNRTLFMTKLRVLVLSFPYFMDNSNCMWRPM